MILPPDRTGHPAPADLAARREGLAQALAAGYWKCDPPPHQTEFGGVRCLRFNPAQEPRGVVVHFHGGAFRIGQPEVIAPFAAMLADRCKVTVVCPAYRLAPEHPFPAGLRDCQAALASVAAAFAGSRLILSGDSAGGGLAASLAANVPAGLAGLTLLSPWLDLTVTSPSYSTNCATDPLFSAEAATEAAALYLQGGSSHDPLVSPLLGPISSLPPTFINVGSGEVLLDDALAFHARLCAEGLGAQLSVVEGMDHVAVTRDQSLPGAASAFEALAGFIDSVLFSS